MALILVSTAAEGMQRINYTYWNFARKKILQDVWLKYMPEPGKFIISNYDHCSTVSNSMCRKELQGQSDGMENVTTE